MPAVGGGSAVFYANAKSRRSQASFKEAVAEFEAVGVALSDSKCFRDVRLLAKAVEEATTKKCARVLIGGGDGTLSLVARHFVDSRSVLGVVPFGTGNALARDLAIPTSIPEACKVIASGRPSRIDLGYAGNDYFVNVLTVGLTTQIVRELDDETKKRFGRAAYVFAMWRALYRVKAFRTRLECIEKTTEFDTLQVVIGNGRYHAGPFPISPEASITEGKLSVYALTTTRRSAFLKLAWKLRTGRQCELPEVYSLETRGGRLLTTPSQKVVIDGETAWRTPTEFKVAPAAIEVLVPQDFKG